MTIEKSPAAASPHKAASRSDGQGSKAKPTEADSQSGGFMAILGALGDASVATGIDASPADAATAQNAALDSTTANNTALDAATLLQQNPQIAAAQTPLAAATANANAIAISTAATTSISATAASAPAAATSGAVADGTALLVKSDPSTLPGDTSQTASVSAKGSGNAPGRSIAGGSGLAIAEQVDSQSAGESATQVLQHASGHAKSGKELQTAVADTTPASSSAAAASDDKAAAVKWMAALEQAKAPQATKALEPFFAPLLVKAEKSTGERVASAFKSAEPGYGGTAIGVSAPDNAQSGAAAPITSPEMQVAEQVTYWVSQNVQNAELKLDGLGQSSVEVSISVQGKEAQITFRTDEATTRGMLEGASAHLKDLLQREGMVLTGVSVGTSGSGDSSGNDRRARQAARQGVITPLQVATVTTQDVGRRVGTVAGRSVDLFV